MGKGALPRRSLAQIAQTTVVSAFDRSCEQEAGIGFEQDAWSWLP